MKDGEFLNWLAERLVKVYGESENVDFVQKTKAIGRRINLTYPDQDSKMTDKYW